MKKTLTSTFHIYLSVDEEFAKKVSEISLKTGSQYNTSFVVGKDYKPHITLYLFSAPLRNKDKIMECVKKLGNKMQRITITKPKLVLTDDGWIMVSLNSGELDKYHRIIVKDINGLREGSLREKYRNKKSFDGLPGLQKRILLKYGDRHAMSLFSPHISISEFPDQKDAKKAFGKIKKSLRNTKVESRELFFVRISGESSGGMGKVLYSKALS